MKILPADSPDDFRASGSDATDSVTTEHHEAVVDSDSNDDQADLYEGLTTVGTPINPALMSESAPPSPEPAADTKSRRPWLRQSGLVTSSVMAIALSFWGGMTVSARGVNLLPSGGFASVGIPHTNTLATLPTLADEAWSVRLDAIKAANRNLDFSVPQAFQGKIIKEIKLPSNKKVIALTFDDGPSEEFSNNILYILEHYNVKATFFLLGQNVREYPERARQMHEQGHALANHSWSHPYRTQTPQGAAAQLNNTSVWIEKATGVKSKFFRPPGGFLHNGMADYAMKQGQTVVMWSADSKDYYTSAAQMTKRVLAEAGPGGIVLFHDGGGDRTQTVAALPGIIEALINQGYTFVTLPELMEMYEQETQATAQQAPTTPPQ